MPRDIRLSHKLIGLAVVAAVGLPLTALAQSIPERMPGDNPVTVPGDRPMPAPRSDMPGAAERGGMPDLRGALPSPSEQTASNAAGPADTLGAMNSDNLIGANVRNSSNEVIGKIDSLLLSGDSRVVGAVVEVGGFLGIGAHQVVVPMEQISMIDAGDVSLPAATKESLKAAPAYQKPAAEKAVPEKPMNR
jgi:hypothetical protein